MKYVTETPLVAPLASCMPQVPMVYHMGRTTSVEDEAVTLKSRTEENWTLGIA